MKTNRKKAFIIALVVSAVMLCIVTAAAVAFSKYSAVEFDTVGMIIGDVIGFLAVFALVYRFVTKPVEEDSGHCDHNIY